VAPVTWRADEAAVQVDTYLDELLASRARPVPVAGDLPAELERTARLLRDALVRFHPSFRFEEDLASRLRTVADGAARASSLVRLPAPTAVAMAAGGASVGAADRSGVAASHERARVLLGGAIAWGVSTAPGLPPAGGRVRARGRRGSRWERPA
jgi:hypothetical protein